MHVEPRITARHADVGDADAIADAQVNGWRVGYRGLIPDDYLDDARFESSRRDRWRSWQWNPRGDAACLVAELDGQVVAFCLCGPERAAPECDGGAAVAHAADRRGEIYSFYGHPTAWGSGVAGPLMSAGEQWLRDQGFSEAVLWVLRDNPRARRFYEKAGWSVSGRDGAFDTPQTGDRSWGFKVAEVEYMRRL